jgi:hypothetical protein
VTGKKAATLKEYFVEGKLNKDDMDAKPGTDGHGRGR